MCECVGEWIGARLRQQLVSQHAYVSVASAHLVVAHRGLQQLTQVVVGVAALIHVTAENGGGGSYEIRLLLPFLCRQVGVAALIHVAAEKGLANFVVKQVAAVGFYPYTSSPLAPKANYLHCGCDQKVKSQSVART